ncbi:DNA-methyltransferase [Psittacicella hinzii]|uniref:Methyltransferase n=1 Tax=Psittacicella hinzii TaxID=2028575 RepID=A0A3A1YW52_9GAMM|nr:site-specific DNA-methyltransferase [Psittacicella hinzii]RIY40307.1 site-specific DNA-methyltransferase [Psittacicella hinzii]
MLLNQVINGNSIVEMNKLPENSVDLIFADPPYWMRTEGTLLRVEGTEFDGCDDEWDQFETLEQYEQFTRDWLSACYRVLKPNGSIWVIGGMQCIYSIGAIMQQLGFWLINDVVWYKKNPTPNFKGTRLNNSHETLIWATKSKKSKYTFNYKTAKELNTETVSPEEYAKGIRKQLGSVWRFAVCAGNERLKDKDGNKLHSTQKPLELLERIIAISSKKGDVVLDPFGGTMTTGAAAKKLGRNYIMIERDPTYCGYGKTRLEQISYEDSDIANAVYDIKPKKVSMNEMIENQYFFVDEWFYLKDGNPAAQLTANGQLNYQGQIIDMHTCVALAKKVKANKLNGFDHWYVMRDGELTSINSIREQYRENIA